MDAFANIKLLHITKTHDATIISEDHYPILFTQRFYIKMHSSLVAIDTYYDVKLVVNLDSPCPHQDIQPNERLQHDVHGAICKFLVDAMLTNKENKWKGNH
jgi:hypothetical protein